MVQIIFLIGVLSCLIIGTSKAAQSADKCQTCKCGIRPASGRIIGGSFAKADEFSWFVHLKTSYLLPVCGSSLINDQYSVTAAHCVANSYDGPMEVEDPKNYVVTFNQIDNINNPDLFYRNIEEFIVHEHYKEVIFTNDIALIKFSSRVTFSNKVYPICLPFYGFNSDNQMGVAIGWGQTTRGPYEASDQLKKLTIPIFSNKFCMDLFKERGAFEIDSFDPKIKLCAANTTSTVCSGDSGGPLAVKAVGSDVLVGIMSTSRCDAESLPDSFTRVAAFESWILSKVSEDSCWCKSLK